MSADFPVGVPVNIASYSLLTLMVAQVVGMIPGEFIHTFGDVHIYENQIELFLGQLTRKPTDLPTVQINREVKDIFAFKMEDFRLKNYSSHPAIAYPVAK